MLGLCSEYCSGWVPWLTRQVSNDWEVAVSLFTLCNNYDAAAHILISHLATAYLNKHPARLELLQQVEAFCRDSAAAPLSNLATATSYSLQLLLQILTIFRAADEGDRHSVATLIRTIDILPVSSDPRNVQSAAAALRGVDSIILELIPELILVACSAVCAQFNEYQAQYVGAEAGDEGSSWWWMRRRSREFYRIWRYYGR